MPSSTLNTTVLAPTPAASVISVTAVNMGVRPSLRSTCLIWVCKKPMVSLPERFDVSDVWRSITLGRRGKLQKVLHSTFTAGLQTLQSLECHHSMFHFRFCYGTFKLRSPELTLTRHSSGHAECRQHDSHQQEIANYDRKKEKKLSSHCSILPLIAESDP